MSTPAQSRDSIREALRDRRLGEEDIARIRSHRPAVSDPDRLVDGVAARRKDDGSFEVIRTRSPASQLVSFDSIDPFHGALLYRLVRHLSPEYALEVGTGIGHSAAHIVAALEANQRGTLLTLEGSDERADLASEALSTYPPGRWRILRGLFADTLPTVADHLPRVDFAFIDGDHLEEAVRSQTDLVTPAMPDGSVIVYDDINWTSVERGWRHECARADCAFALEPRLRGWRRFGVWIKGGPLPGYRGRPKVVEMFGPRWLSPAWTAKRLLHERRNPRPESF